MNAKCGKISIRCFIAWCLLIIPLYLYQTPIGEMHPAVFLLMLGGGIVFFLLPLFGLLFGFIGVRIKELPKRYSAVGLLLNSGSLLFLLAMLMYGFRHRE